MNFVSPDVIVSSGVLKNTMALFAPFRALGLITEDVPFATQRKGKEVFVTLSVGNAWQVRESEILCRFWLAMHASRQAFYITTEVDCNGQFWCRFITHQT